MIFFIDIFQTPRKVHLKDFPSFFSENIIVLISSIAFAALGIAFLFCGSFRVFPSFGTIASLGCGMLLVSLALGEMILLVMSTLKLKKGKEEVLLQKASAHLKTDLHIELKDVTPSNIDSKLWTLKPDLPLEDMQMGWMTIEKKFKPVIFYEVQVNSENSYPFKTSFSISEKNQTFKVLHPYSSKSHEFKTFDLLLNFLFDLSDLSFVESLSLQDIKGNIILYSRPLEIVETI